MRLARIVAYALSGFAFLLVANSGSSADPNEISVSPAQATISGSRLPVISFISPGSLFPVEGTAFFRRDRPTEAENYKALPAYSQPNGARIGEIIMVNPDCVTNPGGGPCDREVAWFLKLTNGTRHQLPVAEYSYGTNALISHSPSVSDGTSLWSKIDIDRAAFWVETRPEEVIAYEALAQLVDHFDRWCDAPDHCDAVTPQMNETLQRIERGEIRLDSCYPQPYEIKAIVAGRTQRYYQVMLAEIEAGSPEPNLSKTGFVPVRNQDGGHTGTFYPRGC